jgi:hypothetical protein
MTTGAPAEEDESKCRRAKSITLDDFIGDMSDQQTKALVLGCGVGMRFFIVNVPAVEDAGTTSRKRKRDAEDAFAEDDQADAGDENMDVDSDNEAPDAKTRLEYFIQVCHVHSRSRATKTDDSSAQLHGGTVHAGQNPRNSDIVVHTRDMTDEEAAKWAYGPPCAQVRLGGGWAVEHSTPRCCSCHTSPHV